MDQLRTGAQLVSRGMRGGNAVLTFVGAVLAARAIAKWLDRPERELLYTRKLKSGQGLTVTVDDSSL